MKSRIQSLLESVFKQPLLKEGVAEKFTTTIKGLDSNLYDYDFSALPEGDWEDTLGDAVIYWTAEPEQREWGYKGITRSVQRVTFQVMLENYDNRAEEYVNTDTDKDTGWTIKDDIKVSDSGVIIPEIVTIWWKKKLIEIE